MGICKFIITLKKELFNIRKAPFLLIIIISVNTLYGSKLPFEGLISSEILHDSATTFVIVPQMHRNCGESSFMDWIIESNNWGVATKTIVILPKLDSEYELQCLKGTINLNLFNKSKVIYNNNVYSETVNKYKNTIFVYKGKKLLSNLLLNSKKQYKTKHKYGKYVNLLQNPKSYDFNYNLIAKNSLITVTRNTSLIQVYSLKNNKLQLSVDLSKQYSELAEGIYNLHPNFTKEEKELRSIFFNTAGNRTEYPEYIISSIHYSNNKFFIVGVYNKVFIDNNDTFTRNIPTVLSFDSNWKIDNYYCFYNPIADYFPMSKFKIRNILNDTIIAEIGISPKMQNNDTIYSSIIYKLFNHKITYKEKSTYYFSSKILANHEDVVFRTMTPNTINDSLWNLAYIPSIFKGFKSFNLLRSNHLDTKLSSYNSIILKQLNNYEFIHAYTISNTDSIYIDFLTNDFKISNSFSIFSTGNRYIASYDEQNNKIYLHNGNLIKKKALVQYHVIDINKLLKDKKGRNPVYKND